VNQSRGAIVLPVGSSAKNAARICLKNAAAGTRRYAAGDLSWQALRGQGFENYLDVLDGLGKLGLRPPMAPMDGPNVAARERGRALIREALKSAR
jgi:hypothetical protein